MGSLQDEAGDRTFLCCEGCKDEAQKDPDSVLKKLDASQGVGARMVNAVIRWCLNNTFLVILAMLAVLGAGWYALRIRPSMPFRTSARSR